MTKWDGYLDALQVAKGLYEFAMSERNYSSLAAFHFVSDEMDCFGGPGSTLMSLFFWVSIFKVGFDRGLSVVGGDEYFLEICSDLKASLSEFVLQGTDKNRFDSIELSVFSSDSAFVLCKLDETGV
ncbi:hypothetical protein RAM80_13240 [Pseudomonas sp. App30]|uniref:hypothetical protein n=1 Tax=Pseudomonas sp. App30 TaxID=3068990 RepID=UPI003A8045A3